MRGVPGSGKSTWIKNHLPDYIVRCSADDFFTDPKTGEYKFDPTKLVEAHEYCHRKAENLCRALNSLVIDNTNIKFWNYQKYLDMAKYYGYTVEIVTLIVDPRVAYQRNIHGVPLETISRMATVLELENNDSVR